MKHYLWYGNTANALHGLEDLSDDLDCWEYDEDGNPQPQPDGENAARMRTYVQEFATYIANDAGSILDALR